ncbi:MAG: hypothetical protein JSV80_05625 [Acidobacteriota bacterium]|nr:MAG: hypothetical protein JSV80_05625 [Acidobacteriota bacterium]
MSASATAVPPATSEAAREREQRLEQQVCLLADELARSTGRLRQVARDKARLSRCLEQVLESLQAGVVLLGEDRRVLAVNAAARQMGAVVGVGRADGDHLGAGVGDSVRGLGDDLDPHPILARATPEGEPHRPFGEAGPAWLFREASVTLPEGGRGFLLVVHDVTRMVELEQLARRRSRLEWLGRMAAEVAHEVRNPLGSLELLGSLLVGELEERPEGRELAEQLLVGVRQLSDTVTRLLSCARGGRVRRAPVDAAALARETIRFVSPVAEARRIRLEGPPEAAKAAAYLDREATHQALLNLLGNALDVTPGGGRVRLGVGRDERGVSFLIEDSGPGVPDALRERVFEPFFSTRDGGTGLGLAVVERVAVDRGGSGEVGRSEWGGASFRLRLEGPAVAARRPAEEPNA